MNADGRSWTSKRTPLTLPGQPGLGAKVGVAQGNLWATTSAEASPSPTSAQLVCFPQNTSFAPSLVPSDSFHLGIETDLDPTTAGKNPPQIHPSSINAVHTTLGELAFREDAGFEEPYTIGQLHRACLIPLGALSGYNVAVLSFATAPQVVSIMASNGTTGSNAFSAEPIDLARLHWAINLRAPARNMNATSILATTSINGKQIKIPIWLEIEKNYQAPKLEDFTLDNLSKLTGVVFDGYAGLLLGDFLDKIKKKGNFLMLWRWDPRSASPWPEGKAPSGTHFRVEVAASDDDPANATVASTLVWQTAKESTVFQTALYQPPRSMPVKTFLAFRVHLIRNEVVIATTNTLKFTWDNDHDGLPDWWEDMYGLDKNDGSDAGSYSNDNDSFNNLEEYANLTSPKENDAAAGEDAQIEFVGVNYTSMEPKEYIFDQSYSIHNVVNFTADYQHMISYQSESKDSSYVDYSSRDSTFQSSPTKTEKGSYLIDFSQAIKFWQANDLSCEKAAGVSFAPIDLSDPANSSRITASKACVSEWIQALHDPYSFPHLRTSLKDGDLVDVVQTAKYLTLQASTPLAGKTFTTLLVNQKVTLGAQRYTSEFPTLDQEFIDGPITFGPNDKPETTSWTVTFTFGTADHPSRYPTSIKVGGDNPSAAPVTIGSLPDNQGKFIVLRHAPFQGISYEWNRATLLPVDIVPDPSMYDSGYAAIAPPLFLSVAAAITGINTPGAGRIGDVVPSVNENGEKHFVSPKWIQEIDGDKDKEVILDAAGLTKADFSSTDGKFEWHVEPTNAGQPDPQDAAKFQVKRDAVGHAVVSIRQKGQTADVVKMNVWIVWCDSKAAYTIPAQNPKVTNDPQIGPVTTIGGGGFIFTHTIQPDEIITAQERPKLEGAKAKADGPPPKDGTHPLFTNEKLADGANNKWDASRQMRFKHANPNGLPSDAFSQPAPLITVPDFPTSPIEGNDDSSTPDEVPRPGGVASGNANDPYQSTSQKTLWSTDAPGFSISKGNVGDTYEFHIQLREFPRVELNGKWYRIGDYKPWRKRVFMKKIHDAQRNIDYWSIDPNQQSVIKQNLDDF